MNFKLKSLLVVLGIPFLVAPLSWADDAPQPTAIPIKIQVVENREFTDKLEEVGKIIPVDSTALTFSASDKLKAKFFKDGAYVKKGDLIAELDNTQAKGELDKAETQYAIDQSKLTRMLALVKKQPDSISKQDIENQKLQTNLAKVSVEQKKADLQNYQLIAPFDGRLTSFNYSVGSRLDSSNVVVSIIKSDPVQVNYSIGQKELGEAKINQKVTVQVDAFKDKTFTGHVNYIAPQVDPQSGRIEVHASIKNMDKLLVPGMFANVTQYSDVKLTYPIVSQNAVIVNGDQRYVWLYTGTGVEQQPVTLGENTNDGYVIIKQGLKVGDKVVASGQQNLKADSVVKVQGVMDYDHPTQQSSVSTEKHLTPPVDASSNKKPVLVNTPPTQAPEVSKTVVEKKKPVQSAQKESKPKAPESKSADEQKKQQPVIKTNQVKPVSTPDTSVKASQTKPHVTTVTKPVVTPVEVKKDVIKVSQPQTKKDLTNEAA
ncbi:efflux RND transporter periplasmic adaptor subunit [Vibrio sp. S4M6]|uniref:efflux RND transporter periplasmic adaptor subunit n=1 Tax=Vibrio sinus TaxID=2946865 RepID=UPI00202A56AB|nr:efflux RND transporter periplasmic adaptor subunit [Vibrio sinus]MCL9783326.1 efflux RND transporter periplasmic adaptor subunit [Vibrio sinus]